MRPWFHWRCWPWAYGVSARSSRPCLCWATPISLTCGAFPLVSGCGRTLSSAQRLEAHPQSRRCRSMSLGERRGDECYPSSELLFVVPAVLMASTAGSVSLRLVGATKAFALFAVAFALNVLLKSRPAWMMLHAGVFAIVICDPMNTLWMNSLYTEFSAMLGVYAAVVLLVVIADRTRSRDAGVATGWAGCRSRRQPRAARFVAPAARAVAGGACIPGGHCVVATPAACGNRARRDRGADRGDAVDRDRPPSNHRPGQQCGYGAGCDPARIERPGARQPVDWDCRKAVSRRSGRHGISRWASPWSRRVRRFLPCRASQWPACCWSSR